MQALHQVDRTGLLAEVHELRETVASLQRAHTDQVMQEVVIPYIDVAIATYNCALCHCVLVSRCITLNLYS